MIYVQVVNNLIASQDFEAFFEAAKYLNIKHLEGNLFLVSNRGEEAQAMNDGRLVASTRTPDEVLNASDEIADAEVAAAEIYSQRWVNPLTMYWPFFLFYFFLLEILQGFRLGTLLQYFVMQNKNSLNLSVYLLTYM